MLLLYSQIVELLDLVTHVHDFEFELLLAPKTKFVRHGLHMQYFIYITSQR